MPIPIPTALLTKVLAGAAPLVTLIAALYVTPASAPIGLALAIAGGFGCGMWASLDSIDDAYAAGRAAERARSCERSWPR